MIETYTNFEAIIRFCAVGSWTLTVPVGSPEAGLLTVGGGIIVRVSGQPDPILSGPVTEISRTWDAGEGGQGSITFSGVSDETLLWRRLTYPLPSAEVTAQTIAQMSLYGPAGHVCTQLVTLNAGPGAIDTRRFEELDVEDSLIGPYTAITTRFDVLGERLAAIAQAAGIGWSVKQTDEGRLRYTVWEPEDRSATVLFGNTNANLQSFNYTLTAPTTETVIVGCGGEGKNRWFQPFPISAASTWVNDNDPGIIYAGSWTYATERDEGEFGDDVHLTETLGDHAEYSFLGTGIRVYVTAANNRGLMRVSVDGGPNTTVTGYVPGDDRVPQAMVFERAGLAYGPHTITIVNAEAKFLVFDAFEVLNEDVPTAAWRNRGEVLADRSDIPIARSPTGYPIDPDDSTLVTDAAVLNQVAQAASEAINEALPTSQLVIAPIDTEIVAFGTHYTIGDVVSVEIDGQTISDVVREVRLTDSDQGQAVEITIGSSGSTATPGIYRQVQRIWTSVRKIEARR
ncbi:hypothetical protein [Acrocarpospora sp. B8E8]|uniref:Gp37-like protein n=1 Tax=Acrocarpospora sp. B8E8 TaxID=3153572 RepID=UPI00325D85D9